MLIGFVLSRMISCASPWPLYQWCSTAYCAQLTIVSGWKGWPPIFACGVVAVAFFVALTWQVCSFFLRWRFQYSVRSLFALVLLVAAPCAWLSIEIRDAKRQQQAVATIRQNGGEVAYDYEIAHRRANGGRLLTRVLGPDFFNRVVLAKIEGGVSLTQLQELTYLQTLSLDASWHTNDELNNIGLLSQLERLQLRGTRLELATFQARRSMLSDAGLAHIRRLRRITVLDLRGNPITDAGIDYLADLSELQELDLGFTNVAGPGLNGIRRLPALRTLNLRCTKISDSGLKGVELPTHLEKLDLSYTTITDEELQNLKPLLMLRELDLSGTGVTNSGLRSVSALANIESLSLDGTRITNAGLAHLAALGRLRRLSVRFTKVTDDAEKEVPWLARLSQFQRSSFGPLPRDSL